ncbi:hypothetical protein Nepgr_029957 [Nepenthes gracilis]|uniref:Uncharacterized protein n=1 Tax=Nepenthes gracilis TaxID=150966 RepID=A0AAD3TFD3_NEPGR|nr:hypothetical protein Nepgr_029957 [Nepenthes gracilis]
MVAPPVAHLISSGHVIPLGNLTVMASSPIGDMDVLMRSAPLPKENKSMSVLKALLLLIILFIQLLFHPIKILRYILNPPPYNEGGVGHGHPWEVFGKRVLFFEWFSLFAIDCRLHFQDMVRLAMIIYSKRCFSIFFSYLSQEVESLTGTYNSPKATQALEFHSNDVDARAKILKDEDRVAASKARAVANKFEASLSLVRNEAIEANEHAIIVVLVTKE